MSEYALHPDTCCFPTSTRDQLLSLHVSLLLLNTWGEVGGDERLHVDEAANHGKRRFGTIQRHHVALGWDT